MPRSILSSGSSMEASLQYDHDDDAARPASSNATAQPDDEEEPPTKLDDDESTPLLKSSILRRNACQSSADRTTDRLDSNRFRGRRSERNEESVASSSALPASSRSETMSGKASHFGTDRNGRLAISKTLAVVIAVIFVGVTVAVGLLVYTYAEPGSGAKPIDQQLTTSGVRPTTQPPVAYLKDVRLPTHLEPILYDVQLLPHVDESKGWKIEGYVKIHMDCKKPGGRNVTVHAHEIKIDESSVTVEDADTGEVISITGFEKDEERQFFRVNLAKELEVGRHYSLEIRSFEAVLNDQLAGFYRSKYGHQGETRYMGVTQFQATDARRAFPCFDEPGIKSMFNVTLGRLKAGGWTTQSNMDQIETGVQMVGQPDYVWDKYNTTVKMSTYLVAFAVSQFDSKLSVSSANFKVWARPDMIDRTDFAANEGAKILKYFEKYFEIDYPLPKTDMFALTDFSAGAMENWGLITYREEYLLYDNSGKTTSATLLQRIIYIVAHELSHQWFGNLVTPTWWTDLWLNEGFASYVEYLGSIESRPKWKWMQLFIVSEVQDVMRIDSLESSHPIYQEVYNPDQIKELFDRISYGKGASIIRMMNHFLTEASFKKGLIRYLNAKKFSNAETQDLWNFLNVAAHEDGSIPEGMTVNAIMGTWTELTGYPVVTLTRSTTENKATLTQTRFLLQESAKKRATEAGKWFVPINFNHDVLDFNETLATHWLTPTGDLQLDTNDLATIDGVDSWIPDETKNNWIIVNAQETGYYRVNYDAMNWKMIQKQLETDHTKIPTENRAQILDDAFNLARAGILDYETALGLTTYLAKETEYIPWRATMNAFSYIDRMLERSSGYGFFRDYMRCLTKNQLKKFQLLEEIDPTYDEDVTYLFKDVLIQSTACKYSIKECTGNATALFGEWRDSYQLTNPDLPTISPNVKSIVYCYGVKNGGTEEWEHAWNHYSKSNLASEKSSMLSALACTKEVWLLSKYLEMTFDKNSSSIRTQDAARAFANIASSVVGRGLAFDFLINNFDRIRQDFSSGISAMDSFINPFSSFNTESEVARMRQFREDHSNELGSGTRAVEQTIESIEINIQWMKNYEKVAVDWFEAHATCA